MDKTFYRDWAKDEIKRLRAVGYNLNNGVHIAIVFEAQEEDETTGKISDFFWIEVEVSKSEIGGSIMDVEGRYEAETISSIIAEVFESEGIRVFKNAEEWDEWLSG